MPAPIEYGVQIADPTQAFLSAFQAGTSIQDTRFKQEQQVQQAAQQKLIQEGFTKLRGPNATAADYANLSMMLPEAQAKAVRESFGMLSGERQQVALREAGEVFSAFKSGKPEIAITRLDRQIEGKRNAGDEAGAKFLETWRDVAKQDPTAAEVYFGSTISQIPGGDKVIESAIKLSAESRAAAKAPSELLKAKGDADKALSDAETALANADNAQAEAKAKKDYEIAKARKEKADADVAAGTVISRIAKAAEEAKPDPGFAIIPEAERTSLGLPAGVYQRNLSTKKIEPVSKELVKIDMGQQRDTLALKELDIPRAQEFSASAASARSLARDSRIIANLLKGKGGGTVIKLTSDLAKTFGIESDTATVNDLANSLAIRGATQLRPPGSGSTSDTEFKAFVSAFPSLANSEEGRELMAKYADAFATRSAKLADHARKLIREDKYSEEEIARFDTSLGAILKDDFYSNSGSDTVKVGNQTYTRPSNFSDAQWAAYKQSMGVK